MQQATVRSLNLAKSISKDLNKNWSEEIYEFGLSNIYAPVYSLNEYPLDVKNTIICYIVFAYSPESLWLDLRKDRIDNKREILNLLGANETVPPFDEILSNKHETTNISIFNFLESIKDWRWRSVFDFLDYASKMSRFASMETDDERRFSKKNKDGDAVDFTEEVDIKTIVNVNKQKGDLLNQARDARKTADELLDQISKEFVQTEHGVQQDFDFSFVETAKKVDPLSWRDFIKERNRKKSYSGA